ncbi:hypothetical protein EN804_11680 [Mesorhizobium sp. M8A.F.Ca.ET.161.01.1.1]|nr:hypothetical protein EOA36_28080 [Mesorhizobium sp. M8A.F.Ca.ET.021.01.1.1]TGP95477.1 hypothetical protein EN861_11265 [Mesorhizobium sp. M8A.F.Ca.ET.218.01.1.1]TGT18533.1 hypothetical protein EN856_11280 [Mesorhizobium sp. M8A.F.Ca.ET.213.01.1.1]TGT89549.1 hypothetical protein EN804_11680 [Mesorhizobium sp. M8A.F.Ca.ET.161.01.1.1]TGV42107.1 hypothetical protein EN785_11670 [Mesorhizobium sp. M8A.F.Ca.ET.142.01.1.1]
MRRAAHAHDAEVITFDQLCQERRLALKDREQREQLAREVMEAFEDGLIDETDLWRALSKRRTASA